MNVTEFDVVQKYIEDAGTVYPVIDGRITMIQSNEFSTNQTNEIPTNQTNATTQQNNQPGSASQFTVSMSVLFVTVVMLFKNLYSN